MRIRRRLPIALGVLLAVAAVALVVVLRKHAPPEPARLLPSADGFVYVNLQWMRRANLFSDLPPVSHNPQYEAFIQSTGFQFERDLEQAAFAISYAPNSNAGQQTHFSEVFIARIQGERLRDYLGKTAGSVEHYGSIDIYSIPLEGRTLRVAILGVDTVAASNDDDPGVIRGMIDRSHKLASPFRGPALLRQFYDHVPLASLAWGVFKLKPAMAQAGLPVDLPATPATVIASVRYLGAVHCRVEILAGSEEEAHHISEQVNTLLALFHAAGTGATRGGDPDVQKFFASLKVEQHKDRSVVTATMPTSFVRKALSSAPNDSRPEPSESPHR
ncbi:MAG: hypothetical protein JOY93_08330 [Acidobacteriales bacterium]|nr:hypothetical protein [Terriglobales bacterium]